MRYRKRNDVSPWVSLDFSDQGGHVGFVTGPFPGNYHWLPRRVLSFLAAASA
jgi:predicted alpha/beta-fold hydrolase